MSVVPRLAAKAKAREALARAARRRYMARPTKAAKATLAKRRRQLAEARRSLARHRRPSRVSRKGAEFIASFEDFRARPYRDAVGVWTIGYGHTDGVGPGSRPLTRKQALALLRRDLDRVYGPPVRAVAKAHGVKLTQGQFDALVSFVYNLGPGSIGPDWTMGQALRSKHRDRIAAAFLLYDTARGRRLAGLTRRRRAERAMFLA